MARDTHAHGITAEWESEWIHLADNDLTRDTYELAPTHFFHDGFHAESVEDASGTNDVSPRRARVKATVSKRLYTVMLRFQQGSEAVGDDPPLWAVVEGSAIDNETGQVLGTGEVPSLN